MKKYAKQSLNRKLVMISFAVFIPMFAVVAYMLVSMSNTAKAYAQITKSVSYANQYAKDFKERMDYSMYLAVIGNKDMEELGNGETTINGIMTVNPYTYIGEFEDACDRLAELATVSGNSRDILRVKNTLGTLEKRVEELEDSIHGNSVYEERVDFYDNNIKVLTSIIQKGINDYIYVETMNFNNIQAELNARIKNTITISLFASVIAIVAALWLTYRATRSITHPIRNLCDLTSKVAEGDFTVKTDVESVDEIAVLTESFNNMTEEIGILVEDIKQQQENLHIAETKLLQAQINPHFLYNTLDTIVWLAEEKKSEEVVSMVTALSDFFRTTLSKGQEFITVKEEKLHIESYLKIQQFRYQDIMDYEIAIDENIYNYVVPKLTLQPLVENALYHGIKNKRGKGMICITGEEKDGRLVFHVTDNGRGMTEQELERLRRNIEKKEIDDGSGGFGAANVNQRIRHYYGEEYGISFQSKSGEGTEVTVFLAAKNIPPFSKEILFSNRS